uniref:Uncharacterized protein n=1 Tax=Pithovirus LCPAC201 TaxID=2506591 RepID=A0A481Z5W8_9VIRU|nr:MAG: hypothetical protein LCPAC201_02970 [Pithovirus LCPAC201]
MNSQIIKSEVKMTHYIPASQVKRGDLLLVGGDPCEVIQVTEAIPEHGPSCMRFGLKNRNTFVTQTTNCMVQIVDEKSY